MKLFENKVGRPSNEILKKRKVFKISVIIGVIAMITGAFCLGFLNIINLRGASYAAGTKVTLNKAPIYSSATSASKAGTKTGTYYLWDNYVKNGRIRITTSKSYVGKTNKITGWINTSSIMGTPPATTKTTKTPKKTTTKVSFSKRDAVKLSKTPVYISSSARTNMGKKTGTYYIYDSKISNGRVKITSKKSYVGKGIVTGWVDASKITKQTNQVNNNNTSSTTQTIKTTLSGSSSSRKINSTMTIYVTLSDKSDSFIATSSNTSVMTIENVTRNSFKIRATGIGSATINVKSVKYGKQESRVFTVKSSNSGISTTAIRLSHVTGGVLNFSAGADVKVYLKDPSDSYVVTSSNQAIVAVTNVKKESFKFQGIGAGTATITATSVKTGQSVSLNYTVRDFELPSSSKFGSNGKNVVKKGMYNGIPVYEEKGGCNNSNVKAFTTDLNQFNRSKKIDNRALESVKAIYLVSQKTFNSAWKNLWPSSAVPGSETNGLSSSGPYSYIILKCDRYYSHTMAHEIGHSIDARYGVITGSKLSDSFKNLYNSYKKNKNALRTYSYGNTKEFFADSFARYRGEASWKFPQDLQNATANAINKVVNLKNW